MNTPALLSFELFPPKDEKGEEKLWEAMSALTMIAPDFVSVTYGAGGGTRDRTLRITSEITARTGIPTVAHLTCVGASKNSLTEILLQFKEAGIRKVLALRGDPESGPRGGWIFSQDGLNHAEELVVLARELDFEVGVALFPDGHPASKNFAEDIDTLRRKVDAGATFGISQFFFEEKSWERLISEVSRAKLEIDLIPGIMPVTNVNQLIRFADLSGTEIPSEIKKEFQLITDQPEAVKKLGIEVATTLATKLLALGAPGLHFFTLNSSSVTREIVANLGIRR